MKNFCFILLFFLVKIVVISAQDPTQLLQRKGKVTFNQLKDAADSLVAANPDDEELQEVMGPWLNEMELHQGTNGEIINYGSADWNAYHEYVGNHDAQLKSASNGNWQFLGPTQTTGENAGIGRVSTIEIISTNTWLAGSAGGGLWKTTDGGSSWSCLTNGLPDIAVSDIAVNPNNSSIIYILTGDGDYTKFPSIGVLKSIDGGATWQSTGLTWGLNETEYGHKIIIDPVNTGTLWVASTAGIHRTTDGGATWTQVRNDAEYFDVELKPNNHNYVYIATKNQVYYDSNYPSSFTQPTGLPSDNTIARTKLAVTANAGAYVYAVFVNSGGGLYGIYRSTNSGSSFSQQTGSFPNYLARDDINNDGGGQGNYDLVLTVNPANKNEVIVGGIDVYRSTNGATSFSRITDHNNPDYPFIPYTHVDQHWCAYNGSTIVEANDGGIWQSNSSFTSFTSKINGLTVTQYYHCGSNPFDYNDFACGAQDGSVQFCFNGSSTFNKTILGDGMVAIWHPDYQDVVAIDIAKGGIQISTDGGTNFVSNRPDNADGVWDPPFELNVDGKFFTSTSDNLYSGFYFPGFGILWGAVNEQNGYNFHVFSELASGISNTNRFYGIYKTGGSGYLMRCDDMNDATPDFYLAETTAHPDRMNYASDIEVDPANSLHIYITFSGYTYAQHVWESWDGGHTFADFTGSLPNIPVYSAASDGTSSHGIYIATEIGVFYRNDVLDDWLFFSNGMPVVNVRDLEIIPSLGKIRAATYGRGLWQSDLYGGCDPSITVYPADYHEGYYYEQVENTIVSTAVIDGNLGNSVTYDAGDYVRLNVGFQCKAGAELRAFIGGCVPGGMKQSLTGVYTGPMDEQNPEIVNYFNGTENTFSLYPNPAENRTALAYKLQSPSHVQVNVIDLSGKEVSTLFSGDLNEGSGKISLQLDGVPKGMYIIQFVTDQGLQFQKLTVQ